MSGRCRALSNTQLGFGCKRERFLGSLRRRTTTVTQKGASLAVRGARAEDVACHRRRRVRAPVPANDVGASDSVAIGAGDADARVRTAVLARGAGETACNVLSPDRTHVSCAAPGAVGRVARAGALAVPANPGVGDAVAAIHRRRALPRNPSRRCRSRSPAIPRKHSSSPFDAAAGQRHRCVEAAAVAVGRRTVRQLEIGCIASAREARVAARARRAGLAVRAAGVGGGPVDTKHLPPRQQP